MPFLWRYLLSQYLKVFFLCVVSFVAILLTMRLDEVAYFISLGPQPLHVLWYVIQQIPYILPIAIPIGALISSILLVQTLSRSHELTSLRACGFAIRDILAPILAVSLLLSALNFYIVSELASAAHLTTGSLKNQLRSVNPLLLMHNKQVMRIKGFYLDTLGSSHVGEYAEDVIFISPGKHDSRLNMLAAKRFEAHANNFIGRDVTLLTSQIEKQKENDPSPSEILIIENIQESNTPIQDFSQMLEKKIWSVNNDHLRLPLLLVRLDQLQSQYETVKQKGEASEIKRARHAVHEVHSEIIRRLSVAIAVFSFTLMGLSFGISISRNRSRRGIFIVVVLGAMYLIAFFSAKSFSYAYITASLLYLLPHVVICGASLMMLRKITKGIE